VAHWLEELARGMRTFKLAGNTDLPLRRMDALVAEYLVHRKAHFRVLVVQYGTVVAFKGLITAGLLLLGGLLVIQNEINVGQFVASEIIIILIMNSAEKLILTMEPIYDVLTAVEKMAQVTDVPLESEHSGARPFADVDTGAGLAIELREVRLPARRTGARPILDGIDLIIPSGDPGNPLYCGSSRERTNPSLARA
jgi:ABC-type bacteriocin/lantibiotic exporter with double-glycine peptidase domain